MRMSSGIWHRAFARVAVRRDDSPDPVRDLFHPLGQGSADARIEHLNFVMDRFNHCIGFAKLGLQVGNFRDGSLTEALPASETITESEHFAIEVRDFLAKVRELFFVRQNFTPENAPSSVTLRAPCGRSRVRNFRFQTPRRAFSHRTPARRNAKIYILASRRSTRNQGLVFVRLRLTITFEGGRVGRGSLCAAQRMSGRGR